MKKYYVYRVTNGINEKFYVGVHYTSNPHDSYYGSGPAIKSAIKKYGIKNFSKEILFETFDRDEAYAKEKELVITSREDPQSYNLKEGGIGGWDYYNSSEEKKQYMHDPVVASKVSETLKEKFRKDESYRNNLIRNAAAASAAAKIVNTGKKRPEHGDQIRRLRAEGRYDNAKPPRNPSKFLVTNPLGEEFVVYNLEEFCKDNDLPYTSLWKTHISGSPAKRGKTRGWKCELIQKGNYGEKNRIKNEQ